MRTRTRARSNRITIALRVERATAYRNYRVAREPVGYNPIAPLLNFLPRLYTTIGTARLYTTIGTARTHPRIHIPWQLSLSLSATEIT